MNFLELNIKFYLFVLNLDLVSMPEIEDTRQDRFDPNLHVPRPGASPRQAHRGTGVLPVQAGES